MKAEKNYIYLLQVPKKFTIRFVSRVEFSKTYARGTTKRYEPISLQKLVSDPDSLCYSTNIRPSRIVAGWRSSQRAEFGVDTSSSSSLIARSTP